MLRHVVSWKLGAADDDSRRRDIATITEALQSLPPLIPEIRSLHVGPNVAYPETNWDVVLIADYDDVDALEQYQKHPEHVKVAQIIGPLVAQRSTVDFLV
jgi:hypothetical protein